MKLNVVLTASAIYLAVLGVGFMFAPQQIGIGAVPADASPALIAYLRLFGGPCLGIAALNWLSRNAEPSTARDAIVLANIIGSVRLRSWMSGVSIAVAHAKLPKSFSWFICF
jgi:hypothetical protein